MTPTRNHDSLTNAPIRRARTLKTRGTGED
jgi:hypothetical protein